MRRWGSRTRSEALFGEGPAGGGQVFFECERLSLIAECDVGLDLPRPVFRRMRDLTGVVLFQSRAQIVGDADVEMLGIQTFEVVDVFHRSPALSELLEAFAGFCLQRPVFALRATPRQPSLREGSPSRSWRSQRRLVEPGGIEPPTSCMPCKRSPS